MSADYPTWKKISTGHYETEEGWPSEQHGWVPDYTARKYQGEYRVKSRWSAKAVWGFHTFNEVKEYVRGEHR